MHTFHCAHWSLLQCQTCTTSLDSDPSNAGIAAATNPWQKLRHFAENDVTEPFAGGPAAADSSY
jgi:hypothetical protein